MRHICMLLHGCGMFNSWTSLIIVDIGTLQGQNDALNTCIDPMTDRVTSVMMGVLQLCYDDARTAISA